LFATILRTIPGYGLDFFFFESGYGLDLSFQSDWRAGPFLHIIVSRPKFGISHGLQVKHLVQIFLKYIFSWFFKNKYRAKQFSELFVAVEQPFETAVRSTANQTHQLAWASGPQARRGKRRSTAGTVVQEATTALNGGWPTAVCKGG
jgi:hypothetical protein